jgi:hypothetical protein
MDDFKRRTPQTIETQEAERLTNTMIDFTKSIYSNKWSNFNTKLSDEVQDYIKKDKPIPKDKIEGLNNQFFRWKTNIIGGQVLYNSHIDKHISIKSRTQIRETKRENTLLNYFNNSSTKRHYIISTNRKK